MAAALLLVAYCMACLEVDHRRSGVASKPRAPAPLAAPRMLAAAQRWVTEYRLLTPQQRDTLGVEERAQRGRAERALADAKAPPRTPNYFDEP